jgi:hypothetical protein
MLHGLNGVPLPGFTHHVAGRIGIGATSHGHRVDPPGDNEIERHGVQQPLIRRQASRLNLTSVLEPPEKAFDVIVTTHKILDLVFHAQVYKLKRDMAKKNPPASASSFSFHQNSVMEVNDETPAHPPTTDCGRPAPVGAPAQGAQEHSGTSGGHACK